MDKILELQEQLDNLDKRQLELVNITETQERELTDEEDKEFDALSIKIKNIAKKIEKGKKFQLVRDNSLLRESIKKIETPSIGGKSDKEYSITRAFRAAMSQNWNDAGLEREIQTDMATRSGKGWSERMLHLDPNMNMRATNTSGTTAEGLELVETKYNPQKLVDILYNGSIMSKLPVIKNTGLKGNQLVPVITSPPTAIMVGETASLPTAEAYGSSLMTATPKEMVTKSAFSRLFDIQSDPTIRSLLNQHVFKAINQKLDEMFVYGTGTAPVLQGCTTLSGRNTSVQGTNGGALDYAKCIAFFKELAVDNVSGQFYWVMNSKTYYSLCKTLKDSANTNSGYIINAGDMNLLGAPIVMSETVRGNLTKGSASGTCSEIVLGKFDETEIFQWDNIALEFDPFTLAESSQIVCRSYSFWDFMHKRAVNYCTSSDILTP